MTIYHKHHIIPRHMGGTDDPSNLVELTVEEHAAAHKKLFEEHGHWQDELAWKGLAKMIDRAEIISQVISKTNKGRTHSEEAKSKMRGPRGSIKKRTVPGMLGKKHSEETKIKMKKARVGKHRSWTTSGFTGKFHSEETRTKMREAALNRKKVS